MNIWTEFNSFVKEDQHRKCESFKNICLLSWLINHHEKLKCNLITSVGAEIQEWATLNLAAKTLISSSRQEVKRNF